MPLIGRVWISVLSALTKTTLIALTVLNAAFWVRVSSTYWLANIPGLILAIVVAVSFISSNRTVGRTVGTSIIFGLISLAGWAVCVSTQPNERPAGLVAVHTVYVLGVIAVLIADGATRHRPSGPSQRQQRKQAEAAQAATRQTELDYAAKIERQQKWVEHATRPGFMTGYEPAALADVVLVRPPYMYGEPGAGLSGSGFSASAVKRGQEGELNFAKSLAKAGLLYRFATFWSVQTPAADGPGTDPQFPTDIDCVLISGSRVWLLDMKNYTQGDVTWRSDTSTDEVGRQVPVVLAIDNVTGGQVGQERHASQQMMLAQERFQKRLDASGVKSYAIVAAVVMMPRPEGMGIVPPNVTWPGGVQAAALPDVLGWLAAEPHFDPSTSDAVFVTRVLNTLIKDESGLAPQLGKLPKRTPPASSVARASALVPAAEPADGAQAPVTVAATVGKTCRECGEAIGDGQSFCFSCGASA